ncbi:conserved hypothetical protein [Ricinus communis]|uniref:Uncharacterized protein n=1 Tax=Ricinus communis TaxID=3988 RepID=B9T0V3_RICCO|nr:conserved hypothetical protein [Ricinus communis]
MKPHSHGCLSTDGSLTHHESKRTFGEKLKQAYESARNGVGKGNTTTASTASTANSLWFSKENERRNWTTYCAEDPIRTMMFLGSWGHT